MTSGDKTLKAFAAINIWKRGSERAPHKPLLMLHALSQVQRGHQRLQPFVEIEPVLKKLLIEFGPSRRSYHPEYPFWKLQNDGIWQVTNAEDLKRRAGKSDPLRNELLQGSTEGGFTEEHYKTLSKRPEILVAVARDILAAHFPSTLHSLIAKAIGIELEVSVRTSNRDSKFRDEVLTAWGHRCGFCGYDIKLGHADLGLDAAHIRWVQHGGPDISANGIACCSIHHLAFDRGAIGIDEERRILISSLVHGGTFFDELFLKLQGKKINRPSLERALPRSEYLVWHQKQVFKGEART